MRMFVRNATDFAADCVRTDGQCSIVSDNFMFLDRDKEDLAVEHLQRKCGNVVITPDATNLARSWLYHTSCERMNDAVTQIFAHHLQASVTMPQATSEMMIGELRRRRLDIGFAECQALVEAFDF